MNWCEAGGGDRTMLCVRFLFFFFFFLLSYFVYMYSTSRTRGCALVGMGLAAFGHVHSMSRRSGHRVHWV